MNGKIETIACLGLGSNLGDRLANLNEAVQRLQLIDGLIVRDVSKIYETEAVGGPNQPDYLNAAISIITMLTPEQLLDVCLDIEAKLGRIRTVKNAAREIDIDIELFGDVILDRDNLVIPHPRMHERMFVLAPMADIAPDMSHPVFEQTIVELLQRHNDVSIKVFDKQLKL